MAQANKRLTAEQKLAALQAKQADLATQLKKQRQIVAQRDADVRDARTRRLGALVLELLGADATDAQVRVRLGAGATAV